MQTIWPPTHDSIFGDTHHGVPNPNVPHKHPWPTRFHGPNWTVPGVAHDSYVERPYAVVPYFGLEGDALGAAPLFENISGSPLVDAVLGIALGFVASPSEGDRPMWMLIGGVSMYAAGMAGLVGTGALLYMSRQQRGARA